MIRKQLIGVVAALFSVVAIITAYFTVIKPLIDEKTAVVEEIPELQPGEEIGTSNRFYMYSNIKREDMASIEISNQTGKYKLVRNADLTFSIEGYEDVALDENVVSSLVTTCGSTLSKIKVMDNAPADKIAEYGLDVPSAYWIVTDTSGKQYMVYVGRELLTGGGYYCRFAGRDSVYVLDTTVEETVLQPREKYVVPYIMFGVSTDDYYTVDNFTVYRNKDKFISIGLVDKDDQSNPDALAENIVTYPVPYQPDAETFFGILTSLSSFTGDSTYLLGYDEDDLRECRLDDPDYTVSFDYGGKTYYFFASDDGDGGYYVLSGIYSDIITHIYQRDLRYLKFDLMDWLSQYIFRRNITTVSSISIKTDSLDETFALSHFTEEKGGAGLFVKSRSGAVFEDVNSVTSFRHYYSDLLAIAIKDYVPEEASDGVKMTDFIADDSNLTMKVTVKTLKGEELEYCFYRYSTRRCAVTVNGRCDFCVLYDVVRNIETDTVRLLNGETIDVRK
ncbi:MAG: DUF4340 domain-containing protein [Clostridia bacterium]|nr:DUF4340 domain-containing protein [Clostridia bacterium]